MKLLKRAAELLKLDEDKYTFLISDENVENGIFFNSEKESREKILEYLIEFNICTLKVAKKLNSQQIKSNLTKLNNILKIKESQNYLISTINGADINDVPTIYELHPTKKVKIVTSLFNEGKGMINSAQSCFIISSLQMLFHLDTYIEKLLYENIIDNLNPVEEKLKLIFAQSQDTNNVPIDIKVFEALIIKEKEIQPFFENGKTKQTDASEFLQKLHNLLKQDYKNLFQAPVFDKFLSEIFLDVNFENVNTYGLDNEIMKSLSSENLNQGSNISPILLIRLPRMEASEKNKNIKIPQIIDINGTQFEFKSAICHTGNTFNFFNTFIMH